MASSTESFETSANSHQSPFGFSTQFSTSFTELLAGVGDDDDSRIPMSSGFSGGGGGIPKFKSVPPPSLPISPPPISPSSYFSWPAGLSPSLLLDSPVLLSSSTILPSPTTGNFPAQSFNWRSNFSNQQQDIKEEDRPYSDFSFHNQTRIGNAHPSSVHSSLVAVSSEETLKGYQQWSYPEPSSNISDSSTVKSNITAEVIAPIRTNSSEIPIPQPMNYSNNSGFQSDSNHLNQAPQTIREQRRSDDGYNWRKYGQKQVKKTENPRSYYKCTYPNCPTRKTVDMSLEGQVTAIEYKGSHNHPKPQYTRRSSASQAIQASVPAKTSEPSFTGHSGTPVESVATPENSSVSFEDGDFDQSSQRSKLGGDDFDDEDEPEAKRWKKESENEGISASENTTTERKPRVVVQTLSDIDILDDGYRWRKYGQKVVKGNPNPRSYYKCTSLGCPVRKHVERAAHDLRAVITTYEGKHNHDVPTTRGGGGNSVNKPPTDNNNNNNKSMAIRPSAMAPQVTTKSFFGGRPDGSEGQAPFTLEMLQNPKSYGFTGLGNSMSSYMNQQQQRHVESMFPRA